MKNTNRARDAGKETKQQIRKKARADREQSLWDDEPSSARQDSTISARTTQPALHPAIITANSIRVEYNKATYINSSWKFLSFFFSSSTPLTPKQQAELGCMEIKNQTREMQIKFIEEVSEKISNHPGLSDKAITRILNGAYAFICNQVKTEYTYFSRAENSQLYQILSAKIYELPITEKNSSLAKLGKFVEQHPIYYNSLHGKHLSKAIRECTQIPAIEETARPASIPGM